MTNPNQEPVGEELTLGQALRLIAERTAFRTEEQSTAVLATIDAHIEAEGQAERDEAKRQADEAEAAERAEAADKAEAQRRTDEAAARKRADEAEAQRNADASGEQAEPVSSSPVKATTAAKRR
jgi:hypothetical protein